MSAWIAVGVATLIVVALRAAFVVGAERVPVPPWFDRIGAYVAPAMTAALLVPHVVGQAGGAGGAGIGPEVVSFAAAVPVALRTRSVGWTLAVGMPVLWIARAVL